MLLGGLAAGVVCLALLFWKHPSNYGVPSCPTRAYLGIYCPGCGSMRATHYLLNGRFGDSLRNNPLVLPLLPLVFLLLVRFVTEMRTGRSWPLPGERYLGITLLVVFAFLFVARNIPWEGFDILRPP